MINPRAKRVPAWKVPRQHRAWVYDQGSLTKRLIEASRNNFSVRVTFQGWAVPNLEERRILKVNERKLALIREVELLCYGDVWVTARSIIPISTLTGNERRLKHLGSKPLGAFLFTSRVMTRSKLQFVEVEGHFAGNNRPSQAYGRRSVFCLRSKPLLVSELFMPVLFEKTGSSVNE